MTAEAAQPARVIVITGTSRGLGRAMAEHFLAKGWIVAGCSRAGEGIDHPAYDHHQLDVSDEQAVVAMVRAVQRRHGRVDALVNNAGIASMNPVLLTPLNTVNRILCHGCVKNFSGLLNAVYKSYLGDNLLFPVHPVCANGRIT